VSLNDQGFYTYSRHPNWGLQIEGIVPLFLAQAVNSSETTLVLLLVFSKLHLIGRDFKLSSRDTSRCVCAKPINLSVKQNQYFDVKPASTCLDFQQAIITL
jgi:hypothetical protein